MKTKVIIDTNIMYAWAELSYNGKITSATIAEMAKKYKLYLTTTSLLEIIIKYRNDINLIRKCLIFRYNSQVEIISIGCTPVSNEQMDIIYYSEDSSNISETIKGLFELKVKKEVEFLYSFLLVLLTGITNTLIDKSGFSKGSYQYQNIIKHSQTMIGGNLNHLKNELNVTLREAYKTNYIKQDIKEFFSTQITSISHLWKINYYCIANDISLTDYNNAEQETQVKILEDLAKDSFLKKVIPDNPLTVFSNKDYRLSALEFFDKLKGQLDKDLRFPKEAMDYMFDKFQKYSTEKKKIDKNDVLDLLIVFSLSLKDCLIVSLDKDLIGFLKKYHPESYTFIKTVIKS